MRGGRRPPVYAKRSSTLSGNKRKGRVKLGDVRQYTVQNGVRQYVGIRKGSVLGTPELGGVWKKDGSWFIREETR